MNPHPSMFPEDPNALMDKGKAFAKTNVREGAREILEWRDTCVLRDGVVRALADIIRPVTRAESLSVAKHLFQDAALEAVASQP